VLEHVVRGAGDDLDLQPLDGLVIDDAAERAGREDLRFDVDDLVRGTTAARLVAGTGPVVSSSGSPARSLAAGPERCSTGGRPTAPPPWIVTRFCASVSEPQRSSAHARMPMYTPIAVTGDGSPDPPSARLMPVTCAVSIRTHSMQRTSVPTSSAV